MEDDTLVMKSSMRKLSEGQTLTSQVKGYPGTQATRTEGEDLC